MEDAGKLVSWEGSAQMCLSVGGVWEFSAGLYPITKELKAALESAKEVLICGTQLESWDSSLLVFLRAVEVYCQKHATPIQLKNFPENLEKLYILTKKEQQPRPPALEEASWLAGLGYWALEWGQKVVRIAAFSGEVCLGAARMLKGKLHCRTRDLWVCIQEAGPESLPIVSLISFLVGVIMAFVGAIQLSKFGATIYVADLVALAMVREMGPVMTGIIICGRIGAAYAALLSSMKLGEELDALKSFNIETMDFVIIPRMFALFIMMPILVLFSNFLGIFGGAFISIGWMDLNFTAYVRETQHAIHLTDITGGLVKSAVFGLLIAACGCYHGRLAGRSAQAVGEATTKAVVSGITSLIIADAIFAFLYNVLGI